MRRRLRKCGAEALLPLNSHFEFVLEKQESLRARSPVLISCKRNLFLQEVP